MKRSVLLSIRPRYARSLLAGTKTAEVRRRFPKLPSGTKLFVYSSSPDRAVLGTLLLDETESCLTGDVWGRFRSSIDIEKEHLDEYLAGADQASILRVASPRLWLRPVLLEEMRSELKVEPAQSYRYLSDAESSKLELLANLIPFVGKSVRSRPERAKLTARSA